MNKTLLLLLLLPFCFAAAAEGAIDRAWVERNYRKTEYRIPMRDGLRSLNLSNAVAVAAYEALRQQGWPGLG